MKKILVIFTGGTIGSTVTDGIISVNSDSNFQLISLYEAEYGSNAEFSPIKIMETLSENMTAYHWELLCNYLNGIDFSQYSGIIITHGSDTLAYTSSLVGMMFRHTTIPIILVASNKPLGNNGSNGLKNFAMAVEHILSNKGTGIFTAYDKICLSTRLLPADTCLDRFSLYGGDDSKALESAFNARLSDLELGQIHFKKEILIIHGYPNINFENYNLSETVAAVLYVPYHSGTACTDCKAIDKSLLTFLDRCKKGGIPLYICGLKKSAGVYDTTAKLLESGAKPLYGLSDISAYTKLMIAYNQNKMSVNDVLTTNLYFETVDT